MAFYRGRGDAGQGGLFGNTMISTIAIAVDRLAVYPVQMAKNYRTSALLFVFGFVSMAAIVVLALLPLSPVCKAARSLYGDSYTDGYGSFQNMLAGDFKYLGRNGGSYTFIVRINSTRPNYNDQPPLAKYFEVELNFLGNVSDSRKMSYSMEAMNAMSGERVICPED